MKTPATQCLLELVEEGNLWEPSKPGWPGRGAIETEVVVVLDVIFVQQSAEFSPDALEAQAEHVVTAKEID